MEERALSRNPADVTPGPLSQRVFPQQRANERIDASKRAGHHGSFWRPFSVEDHRLEAPVASYWKPLDEATQGSNDCGGTGASLRLTPSSTSAFRPVKLKRPQCSFCGISFLNNGQLVGHIRIHTGMAAHPILSFPHISLS